MRKRPRVDANQAEIASAFRACGYSVLSLAALGSGVPDLVIGKARRMAFVEVKTPKGAQTPEQIEFMKTWRGIIKLARNMDDVQQINKEWFTWP